MASGTDQQHQRRLTQIAEFGEQQHEHQCERHRQDQREACLRAVQVLELSTPFDLHAAAVDRHRLRDRGLCLAQEAGQVAPAYIEPHDDVAPSHFAHDHAFARAGADGGHLGQRDLAPLAALSISSPMASGRLRAADGKRTVMS